MAQRKIKRIDHRKYSKILSNLDFSEIYLESSSTDIKRQDFFKHKDLTIELNDRASFEQTDNRLRVVHRYYLKAIESEQKAVALKINATFCLIFQTKGTIEKEFFDIFKKVNLPLNSWPYLREFVQNMTQRMNIPPLTLPFFLKKSL